MNATAGARFFRDGDGPLLLSIAQPTFEQDFCVDVNDKLRASDVDPFGGSDAGVGCDLRKMCGKGSSRLQSDGSCVIDVHLPGNSIYFLTLYGVTGMAPADAESDVFGAVSVTW